MAGDAGAESNAGVAPSRGSMMIGIAVVTLVATGAGFGVAWFFPMKGPAGPNAAQECRSADASLTRAPDALYAVKQLPAILTKLTGVNAPWVRIELSILHQKDLAELEKVSASIANDIMAYIRSLTPEALIGATNFELLRSDFQEIAKRRTGGKAREVYVRTLLLE